MKIHTTDTVKVIAGKHKGTIAKVVEVIPSKNLVKLEGINLIKRFVKPNQLNPRGGSKDLHVGIDVSKVALVVDGKDKTSRIGYDKKKDGSKVRVARALGNKEVK
jgi:large subunit ribosomal protein L24